MLSISKNEEKRKLLLDQIKEESLWNHETNYYLSCCVIDQKKNFFMLCFWFDGLMIVRWMMVIEFPYLIFFWSLNSYNPELILISDYDPELFLYFLASLQCNLRLVLSKLFYVIAGQKFSWSSLPFHPVNFTSSLHLAITFWLIIFYLVFFLHQSPTWHPNLLANELQLTVTGY